MNDPLAGTRPDAEDDVSDSSKLFLDDSGDRDGRFPDPRERLAEVDSIDAEELIELLCTDQVDRWRAGERIPAEAYLALHPTLHGGSEAAFELVYGEFLIRESLGEPPKIEEFCWRFPHFADRLRRQLGLHHALGEVAPKTERDLRDGDGQEPAQGLAVPIVPGFEIVDVLGQGGMSVVYLARQVALNRLVALKVIRARVYADPEVAARFHDEAEAAARFQHPNIVQVYEVGESEGQGYLVLEYASGGSLQQKLGGNPQPPRDAARLVELLGRAVHYAHQRAIVHRDLKPANVVLTDDGTPKITDFGLAKLMEREAGLTRTGDIMGTPRYMAPEQAHGTPADVTAAADTYALGVILYEMLTGRPPFMGSSPLSTLSQAAEQEALPPGRLQRHLPRELDTICLKCLEKDPRRRYACAQDLADDLRRFLDDRPIVARRISRAEWLWRWCRREPVKAALAAGLAVAVVVGFLGVAAQKRRAEERALAEASQRARAELAETKALDNLYSSRIAQARLEWRLNNVLVARQLLEGCDTRRQGWEWRYLQGVSHSEIWDEVVPAMTFITAVAFSPDGRRFAFAATNPYGATRAELRHPVEVWETAPPRRIVAIEAPGVVARLSFSSDGRRLASSGHQAAELRDATTGAVLRAWPEAPIGMLTYSPDGKTLASCWRNRVSFWDPDSGRLLRTFASASGRVTYRPDGHVVAVSGPVAVELRDTSSGGEICRLPHGPGNPELRQSRLFGEDGPDLAFSPDGRWLAVATEPPRVWDATTGVLRHQLSGHDGTVQGIAFGPDGRHIATAGVDSTVRIWDARTGAEESVLRGHSTWAGCVTFHPDGWCLLSGSRQAAEVKLWDLTRHAERTSLRGHLPTAIHFDEDGRRLRTIGPDGRLYLRDAEGAFMEVGPMVDLSVKWQTPAVLAEFSADGRRLATVAGDRRVIKLWDAADGRELGAFGGLTIDASYLAISRDGGRVAAMAANIAVNKDHRDVRVWDTATGRVIATFGPTPAPTKFTHGRVALDPAGARIAFDDYEDAAYDPVARAPIGHFRPFIIVHEVDGGRALRKLPMPGASIVYCLTFSPDGTRIAAGDDDGRIWIWDAKSGKALNQTKWDDRCFRLAFSPDGCRLAGVNRVRVQVRDAEDGREILILRGTQSRTFDGGFNPVVAWSPDGGRLACSNWDQSISIWNGPDASLPAETRWATARSRAFVWHLDEADAAIAAGQAAAAGFHLDRLVEAEPPDATSLVHRGEIALRLRRLETAGKDFARWLASGAAEDREAGLTYARLLVICGDIPGYQALRRRLLDSFEKQPHAQTAWQIGRIIGLAPGPVAEAESAVRLIKIPASDPTAHTRNLLALAMAHYRAGQWEPARAVLRKFMAGDPQDHWLGHPLLAVIEHHLGHDRDAADQLAKARAKLDESGEHETSARPFVNLGWFEYDLLYREAVSLIGSKESGAGPHKK